MELEWYWPAKQMSYVRDISEQYEDGARHLEVSSKVDDVFMILFLLLIPLCFMTGFLLRWILVKKKHDTLAKNMVCGIRGNSALGWKNRCKDCCAAREEYGVLTL